MDHLPWLLERASESGGEPCGHALMASCPPEPFSELGPDLPFGYRNVRQQPAGDTTATTAAAAGDKKAAPAAATMLADGQRTWELTKADLATLMDLSGRLNLDGEITPVMAWAAVRSHPRFFELGADDFARLCEELGGKVRCYGYVQLHVHFHSIILQT
jgi:hypothetical protein